jgi:hypothetical protein
MVRVQQKSTRQNHRLSRNRPAFPAQWCYGLYALSPVTRLCCHRHRRDAKHHRQLDASRGASGPHDFAVRDIVIRLVTYRVHRIPLPTFVTIAKRPSYRRRDAREDRSDLPDGASGICTTGNLRMAEVRASLSASFRGGSKNRTMVRNCAPENQSTSRPADQAVHYATDRLAGNASQVAVTPLRFPRSRQSQNGRPGNPLPSRGRSLPRLHP